MKPIFERVGDFILGRGFYIVLILCVGVIGVTGYFLLDQTGRSVSPEVQSVTGEPTITLPDSDVQATPDKPARETGTPNTATPSQSAVQRPQTAQPAQQTTEPATATAAEEPAEEAAKLPEELPTAFTWPVKGEILAGHSVEALAYDVTMQDWRIHSGMDIAAAVGTSVLSTSDGIVQAVFSDEMMGTTIIVEHGGGLVSAYSNLSEQPTVSIGDVVQPGTVMGTVGETALAESAMDSHLHFEMSLDSMSVDPLEFLPPK